MIVKKNTMKPLRITFKVPLKGHWNTLSNHLLGHLFYFYCNIAGMGEQSSHCATGQVWLAESDNHLQGKSQRWKVISPPVSHFINYGMKSSPCRLSQIRNMLHIRQAIFPSCIVERRCWVLEGPVLNKGEWIWSLKGNLNSTCVSCMGGGSENGSSLQGWGSSEKEGGQDKHNLKWVLSFYLILRRVRSSQNYRSSVYCCHLVAKLRQYTYIHTLDTTLHKRSRSRGALITLCPDSDKSFWRWNKVFNQLINRKYCIFKDCDNCIGFDKLKKSLNICLFKLSLSYKAEM